jgi:hypothetical protein
MAPLLMVSGTVQAQGLFEALFGPPARRAPEVRYVPAPFPSPFQQDYPEFTRPRARPRPETVAVPPPVMPKTAKPARVTPDQEIVANLLADATLQRGDIVVFPDGPRVYRGKHGSRTLRDFEDLRTSSLVPQNTRQTVLASTPARDVPSVATADAKPAPTSRSSGFKEVAVTGATTQRVGARTP